MAVLRKLKKEHFSRSRRADDQPNARWSFRFVFAASLFTWQFVLRLLMFRRTQTKTSAPRKQLLRKTDTKVDSKTRVSRNQSSNYRISAFIYLASFVALRGARKDVVWCARALFAPSLIAAFDEGFARFAKSLGRKAAAN